MIHIRHHTLDSRPIAAAARALVGVVSGAVRGEGVFSPRGGLIAMRGVFLQ